jgi:periplasmic copper chaperone A
MAGFIGATGLFGLKLGLAQRLLSVFLQSPVHALSFFTGQPCSQRRPLIFFSRISMQFFKLTISAVGALACSVALSQTSLPAPVEVQNAWVRSTVPGQKGTGAFMNLTAKQGMQLVGVASPAAAVAEVHEMKMEGEVMKMRAVAALDLPAGKAVQLKPGGYHLMLLDLKAPLLPGSLVPVTLRFKDAKGLESSLVLSLPVSTQAPGGAAAGRSR